MQKPHIVYFQQNLAVGATEEYFYLLMEGIDRTRFAVTFVCPKSNILDALAKRTEALGIKVYRYALESSNYLIILHLASLFRRLKPDLIHFNDPCLNGIIAGRLAGVRMLIMTHHTPELNRKYNLKGRILERIAFRYCGLYAIFIAEENKEIGIEKDKISRDRSFVIYYGLSPEKFSQRCNKKEIYDEFSVDEDCHIIGNIARLNHQKGQRYLIEAASIIVRKNKSVKFFLVGEGELKLELKAKVRANGLQDYFIFTGYRTDIPRLLSAFEMLVMPSLFEGLAFAAIEASAMGIPVIATAVGGMQRSVVNGKTGLIIPPRDPQALASAILWMLEHRQEAKEMGLAGRKHFAEFFTQDRMVEKTQEFYKSLLANSIKKSIKGIISFRIKRFIKNSLKKNLKLITLYERTSWLRVVTFKDYINIKKLNLFLKVKPYSMVSYQSLSNVYALATLVEKNKMKGCLVECGVYRGGCVAVMADIVHRFASKRKVWLFDSFQGCPEPTEKDGEIAREASGNRNQGRLNNVNICVASRDDVVRLLSSLKLSGDNIVIVEGWFQETLPKIKNNIGSIAILRLDADWYESTKCCLENLYNNVVSGGYVIIDDYGCWEGCKKAADEFLTKQRINTALLKQIDAGCYYFQKP